ncbi:MAG: MFS transporter [Nesterenkonia sp.]|nr:MFS transporter [Nesterenkonia sp.]
MSISSSGGASPVDADPGARPSDSADRMTPSGRRALFAAVTGTLIEWYDYALYGAAAGLVIGPLFFADVGPGATLAAFATFAVGFVARPLGGVLIGHLGDRYGRRPAMMLTILLMGIATVAIGLLPTTAAIGVAAPILLVVFRLIQGMGAGAELAGAMTIVAEFAPAKRRGLLTSFVLATPPAGMALATGAFLLVSALGDDVLLDWAWRVPFLASVVLFALAVFIRRHLEETPEYVEALTKARERGERQKVPAAELLRTQKRPLFLGFLAMTGHNALNYAMAVFALSLMTSEAVGLERSSALAAVTIGTLFGVVGTPFGGWASDRIGARRVFGIGSALGVVFAFPLFSALAGGDAFIAGLMISLGYGIVIAMTAGGQGAFLAGLFPARERYSGIAMTRELNGAIVAGLTPLTLAWIIELFDGAVIAAAIVVSVGCLISALAIMASRNRDEHL